MGHKKGFLLIDTLLTLMVILILISILLTVAASYFISRRSSLKSRATKIASEQIDALRKQAKVNWVAISAVPCPVNTADYSLLPQAQCTMTLTNFQDYTDIKTVQVTIGWTERGSASSVKLDTVLYEHGLN